MVTLTSTIRRGRGLCVGKLVEHVPAKETGIVGPISTPGDEDVPTRVRWQSSMRTNDKYEEGLEQVGHGKCTGERMKRSRSC